MKLNVDTLDTFYENLIEELEDYGTSTEGAVFRAGHHKLWDLISENLYVLTKLKCSTKLMPYSDVVCQKMWKDTKTVLEGIDEWDLDYPNLVKSLTLTKAAYQFFYFVDEDKSCDSLINYLDKKMWANRATDGERVERKIKMLYDIYAIIEDYHSQLLGYMYTMARCIKKGVGNYDYEDLINALSNAYETEDRLDDCRSLVLNILEEDEIPDCDFESEESDTYESLFDVYCCDPDFEDDEESSVSRHKSIFGTVYTYDKDGKMILLYDDDDDDDDYENEDEDDDDDEDDDCFYNCHD